MMVGGETKASRVLVTISVLLLVLPSLGIVYRAPIFGYELEKYDHILNDVPIVARQLFLGPFSPDLEEQQSKGVVLSNMTGMVANGNITSLSFEMGVKKGYAPLELNNTRIHIWAYTTEKSYAILPDRARTDTNIANITPLKDPDGLMERNLLDENASVLLTMDGFMEPPGHLLHIYVEPTRGRVERLSYRAPKVITQPPYDRGNPNSLAIIDLDGTYPKPDNDYWIIDNETRIENVNMTVERNLMITGSGRLLVENSTLRMNSSSERRLGIYVGSEACLEVRNSTIDAQCRTAPANTYESVNYDDMYEFVVYGHMKMEATFVDYALGQIDVLSDNASIRNSTFNTTIACTYSSPEITGNAFLRDHGIALDFASPRITANTFGAGLVWEPGRLEHTRSSISMDDYSEPYIANNTFNVTEITSSHWSHPRIENNTFRDNYRSLYFHGYSYGTVEHNTIINSSTGIWLESWSCITVKGNIISAGCGIELAYWSTASIIDNTFRDYEHYGVHSNRSFVELSGNTFSPSPDHTRDSCGALQEWSVAFDLVDENRNKDPIYNFANIKIQDRTGHIENGDQPAGFWKSLPEYKITNEGRMIKYNPYAISVSLLGSGGSTTLTVNRSQAFYLIMKQAHPWLASGAMALLLATGIFITFRIMRPKMSMWIEERRRAKESSPPPPRGTIIEIPEE